MMKTQPIHQKEQAQSMVEFAVSAIVLILLLAAIIDFGRAFFTYVAMRDAAQEAAIYGSICPRDNAKIDQRARTSSTWPISFEDNTDIDVYCSYVESNASCGSTTPTVGSGILVVIEYPNFQLTTPILTSIIGADHIDLRATVSDTILRNDPCAY